MIFIACNPGSNAGTVNGYLRRIGITWPTVMDEQRDFEQAMGVKKIGLTDPHNTWELKIVNPDGRISGGDPLKLKEIVERHLKNAKWRVEPDTIPETMKNTWTDIEFGRYARSVTSVQRFLKARDPKTKAAAEKLMAVLDEELNTAYAAAEQAESTSNKIGAYRQFEDISTTFRGMPKAKEATDAVRRLAKDPDLKDELRALGALKKTQLQLASRNRQQRRAAVKLLEAIVERYPDTEAGKTAADLLKEQEEDQSK